MTALTIRTSDDDASVTLPQAVLERLGMVPGQELQVVEEDGSITLRRKRKMVQVADGEIEAIGNYDGIDMTKVRKGVMENARRIMRENHDVLRRLAE